MSRIKRAFEKARSENRAALIIYLCGGDPSLEWTEELILSIARAGADVIEVGVPFSDPTADGRAIQLASERALKAGATMRGVLERVAAVRDRIECGVLLFGYYNPILAYGEEALVADAKRAGVDGVLVVDLPVESASSLLTPLGAAGLDFIPLVAPTTPTSRLEVTKSAASSFVYYVSLTGVTGANTDLEKAAHRARDLAGELGVPVAVGFGVKTANDVSTVARHADGVVVGSAVVDTIAAHSTLADACRAVEAFVGDLASALRR